MTAPRVRFTRDELRVMQEAISHRAAGELDLGDESEQESEDWYLALDSAAMKVAQLLDRFKDRE